jgi:streptomycin 6-kinase
MIRIQRLPTAEHAKRMVTATAAATGADPARAWRWAFLRAMEEISWAVDDHAPDDLRLHLAVATALHAVAASFEVNRGPANPPSPKHRR